MKACVRFAPMIGAREGELPADEAGALAAHLVTCPACQARAADLVATEGLLAEALYANANARDFGPFLDQVMARVDPAGVGAGVRLVRAPASAGRLAPLFRAIRNHWIAAVTASALAILAAVAGFMYVQRDVDQPEQLASLELSIEGGNTVLQTSDGPVVLLEPDDDSGS
jgi:anti-sigma factor RsiW